MKGISILVLFAILFISFVSAENCECFCCNGMKKKNIIKKKTFQKLHSKKNGEKIK